MMQRRDFSKALWGLSLASLSARVQAQSQSVKLLVGFAAGGSVDLTARALADAMKDSLGRPVIVENKPGAAGRLVLEAVKQARPDGDTLMLVPHGPMTLFPWIHRNLRYDPTKDFTPIGRVCVVDYALTTGPATPAKTMGEYLQWARDPKNKASYGSPGAGTIPHFIGQGFTQRTRTDIVHVPYKGSALTMVDLMGGSVSLGVSPLADAIEHHRNGKVRILATTGSQRSTALKDVPTLKEAGIDLVVDGWYGIYAPAGLPDTQLQALSKALESAVLKQEDFFIKNAMRAAPLKPELLAQLQRAEMAQWEPWVKASGFKAED
ncbi:MAG: ABC transporter substrate-binding protein [Limnohabitans sp.]|jgi:tripartite-type tricarboxylate transporter receptor subunit TctC|nr:ABC transporter substrate-binding protein [Limnohabitans sp.]